MNHLRIILLALCLIATVSGHNITDILSDFPEYSVFNDYLTETKLSDEIDSRETITVLVFNNSVVTNFAANQPLSVVKSALSVHILLDYFDNGKLLTIGGGSMITTTLYQTTGRAGDSTGFVKITDLKDGKVEFRSVAPESKIEALYTKSVKQFPYNISVLEINSPIIPLEILPKPSDIDISALLEAEACRTFSNLLKRTGVLAIYRKVAATALTVFVPSDASFRVPGLPDFEKLTNAELVSLLLYHALPIYVPEATLKMQKDPMATLASNVAGKFALTYRNVGGSEMLESGYDESRIVTVVIDSVPISIFTISNVLLPMELFGAQPPPATVPTPAPENSPPSVSAPAAPFASSPAPVALTSPAIPTPAQPTSPPADSPTADMNASGVDRIKAPVIFLMLVMVSISGIFF